MNSTLPKELNKYLSRGWPVLPLHHVIKNRECSCGQAGCSSTGKHPRTASGLKDASKDREIVNAWFEKYPLANWGIRTGSKESGGAGIVVIDLDCHGSHNGMQTWKHLVAKHPETLIKTLCIHTGGGGLHFYFKYPAGHAIKSGSNLYEGVDVRGNGGYVVAPPSQTHFPYTVRIDLDNPRGLDSPLQEIPEWLLEKLDIYNGGKPITRDQVGQGRGLHREGLGHAQRIDGATDNLKDAPRLLNALAKARADDYQSWLEVGMALFECGQGGLELWDGWSRQSSKYESGKCSQKWATFTEALTGANKISFASLVYWASEDKGTPIIREAPQHAKPSDYEAALAAMGYSFRANEMNDAIYLGGTRLNDLFEDKLMRDLYESGYKSEQLAQHCIGALALSNQFHPIKDYLNSLKWNGEDNISHLAECFTDKDGVFPELLQAWLVGAVDRVIGKRPGQQHPMLVLDGKQGIGKSRFVSWLGSPLPAFYIQSSINCEDKDFLIQLCSKFCWEVEELDSIIRRADVGALKAFLSKEIVDVRKPYGHGSITKPATASFIGTINNSGGFLADPTGSRRFRVCTLTAIDWKYSKLDVNQVWAQAVALFHKGKSGELSQAMNKKMQEINDRYEVDDPIAFEIAAMFAIDPEHPEKYTATAQIMEALRQSGKISIGNDRDYAMRIGNVLVHLGCKKDRVSINGQRLHVWRGVFPL